MALEKQLQLVERMDVDDALFPSYLGDNIRKAHVESLTIAAPFFVSREICGLLEDGLPTFPNVAPSAVEWPSPHGFICFDCEPVAFIDIDDNLVSKAVSPMALSWTMIRATDGGALVAVKCYGWSMGLPIHIVHQVVPLDETFGWRDKREIKSLRDYMGHDVNERAKDSAVRCLGLLLSFLSFIAQPFVQTQRTFVPRHTRKRVVKSELEVEPIVNVILLRRKTGSGQGQAQPLDVEWSCRWAVRGHWRNQWYPREERNKPKFISPYIKGPDDKPFKKKGVDLYAVVR